MEPLVTHYLERIDKDGTPRPFRLFNRRDILKEIDEMQERYSLEDGRLRDLLDDCKSEIIFLREKVDGLKEAIARS